MVKARPDGYPSLTPYLIVRDGAAAIDFYCRVLGARERMRMPGPGGRVGHAELDIGTSLVMLADEAPEHDAVAPGPSTGRSVSLHLYVDDADKVMQVAKQAGVRVIAEIETKFYGDRLGSFVDPFGHAWHVATHVEDVPEDELRRRVAALAGG
ncbi:MAG TPA: VOC family protein [Acetobacteraceae bacterium]|jgi:PhnB protein